jgi:hypothetical protein
MNYCKSLLSKVTIISCTLLITANVYAQHFTTVKNDEGIELRENGKKVFFYQVRPKSIDGKYAKAGYIHPLYSLDEKVLTDDMPKDHPYHHGIFWAWHQIILNNKQIAEGWVDENISWNPVEVDVSKNKKSATLHSEVLWKATVDNKPTDIIKENTKIKVYPATSQYRIMDFDIHLYALIDSLKIGGSDDAKGYGGFCLRLKLPKDISFVSQDKVIEPQETAVVGGPWMNITGSFEGQSAPKSGVIVFCKPTNSGQQPWILRKVTSMQNVPFPGRIPVDLPKKGIELKYRVIIHNGEMSNDEIDKLYKDYTSANL